MSHAHWRSYVCNRLRDSSRRTRSRTRTTSVRIIVVAGTHAHSGEPPQPLSGWRRSPEGILAHARSLLSINGGGAGDEKTSSRLRHLPDHPTRPHHYG